MLQIVRRILLLWCQQFLTMLMICWMPPATEASHVSLHFDIYNTRDFLSVKFRGDPLRSFECCSNGWLDIFFVHPPLKSNMQYLWARGDQRSKRDDSHALQMHKAPIPEKELTRAHKTQTLVGYRSSTYRTPFFLF